MEELINQIKELLDSMDFNCDVRNDMSMQRKISCIHGMIIAAYILDGIDKDVHDTLFTACYEIKMNINVTSNVALLYSMYVG